MKPQQIFPLCILTLAFGLCFSCQEQDEKVLVNKYLQQAIDVCEKYNTIAYKEISFNGEGKADTISAYFEKMPSGSALDFRFEAIANNLCRLIYNGSEQFTIGLSNESEFFLGKDEYMLEEGVAKPLPAYIGYGNSPVAYANAFKLVLEDTTVVKKLLNDTTINGYSCKQIQLHFDNKRMYGDVYHVFGSSKIFFDYTFFIDEKEHVLRQLILSTSFGERGTTQYVDYVFNQPRADVLWNLADYEGLTEYVYVDIEVLEKGASMPTYKARILDGEEINQSYLKAKPSLLFFWFMGCGAGKMTYPIINDLVKKYPEITILGMNSRNTDEDAVRKYKEKHELNFPIVLGGKDLSAAFGVDACPVMLIFDKKGTLVYTQEGYYDGLEADLIKVLDSIK